jgi:splicing factor 3A subunit 2
VEDSKDYDYSEDIEDTKTTTTTQGATEDAEERRLLPNPFAPFPGPHLPNPFPGPKPPGPRPIRPMPNPFPRPGPIRPMPNPGKPSPIGAPMRNLRGDTKTESGDSENSSDHEEKIRELGESEGADFDTSIVWESDTSNKGEHVLSDTSDEALVV